MHALQKNTTIAETSKMTRWGGSGLYKVLQNYNAILHNLEYYSPDSKNNPENLKHKQYNVSSYFKKWYSFPEEAGDDLQNLSVEAAQDILFDELNKHNIYDSVKIAAVRHPLARLQSCWRDKFSYWGTDSKEKGIKHDHILAALWNGTWIKIEKDFETEETRATKEPGNLVSFEAFLDYLTSQDVIVNKNGETVMLPMKEGMKSDHWVPIYQQCNACLINYSRYC